VSLDFVMTIKAVSFESESFFKREFHRLLGSRG
jgi:hypothetical protein